jgi:hypothetical protein
MKKQLALRIVSKLMGWETDVATTEFDWLRLMVETKFDHYQGYGPGDRFYVHLIHWLEQFAAGDERQVAYQFLRDHLVYIGQREMHHLVSLSFPAIQRRVRTEVGYELGLKVHHTWLDPKAMERVRVRSLRTLYVALSDGARIDMFRRENEGVVSNEQVVASSEITRAKWDDLLKELRKRLKKESCPDENALFERICLIDDFTASGSTLIQFDDESATWKGKLQRFCEPTEAYIGSHISEGATVHMHHYLASQRAANTIDDLMAKYKKVRPRFSFDVTFCHVMRADDVISDQSEQALVNLIKTHYDSTVESDSLKKDVWYGYKQCGLPVVLDHNAPNNSIALLWGQGKDPNKMRPLFPRKQRHVDHGQSV